MKRLAKSLLIAKIKAREKIKPHTWNSKGSSWGQKPRKADGGSVMTDEEVRRRQAEMERSTPTMQNRGARKYAEGGNVDQKPAFDPSQPFQAAASPADNKPAFDPSKPFESAPQMGALAAGLHGAAHGATFNFADELAGIHAAAPKIPGTDYDIPEFVGPIPARMLAGAGRLGMNAIRGNDPDAATAYEKARDEERAANEQAKKDHPYVHAAGELAGSIPAMAALPEAGIAARVLPAAGKLAKFGAGVADAAVTGGEYGALSGAGEGKDASERTSGALSGAGSGIIGGAIAPVLGSVAGAAYDKFGKPLVGAIRGAIDPIAEASRRLGSALKSDQELIAAGKADGMSPADWVKARAAGEPVTLADLGSSNTQALLRSSANTSPEGRAVLEKALQDRFAGQGERVADEVRGLVAGGANANKTADQLAAEYDVARGPAYKAAFSKPDAQSVWTPELEQITQAPVVQNAIRMANVTAKNEAAKIGLTPMKESPFGFDATDRLTLKTRPDGTTVTPNLQYWDVVKKNLDKMGADGQAWSRTLRDHLDDIVPEYGKARGTAAQFFGERDALDAGRKLAGKRVDPATVEQAMRKMNPQERDLFREGYASDLADRVIGNIRDNRDVTKAMFASPNERRLAATIFGPGGMKTLENRMSLETIMDASRKAMGNSTTARQLIEAGLAGGALEGYISGWDPTHIGAGIAGGVGARKFLGSEMAAGARKFVGKVDAKTAKTVAELLTSDDPAKLRAGMQMAAKNQDIANGLRKVASKVALAGQNEAVPRVKIDTTGWGMAQRPSSANADDKNKQP